MIKNVTSSIISALVIFLIYLCLLKFEILINLDLFVFNMNSFLFDNEEIIVKRNLTCKDSRCSGVC